MAKNDIRLELDPDEEVFAVLRRRPISQVWRWLFLSAWILVPFFFFFPLLSFGLVGLSAFVGMAGSGIVYALREWQMWYFTMWVITDRRIIDIDQMGWVRREVNEVTMNQIKTVHIKRDTIGAKLGRYGTIWIESGPKNVYDLELRDTARPADVRKLIHEIRHEYA